VSVTGVSSSAQASSLLSTLLEGVPSLQSAQNSAPATAGGSSAAYLLSLGHQQAQSAVVGYNQLGKLVNQADDALAGLARGDTLQTGGSSRLASIQYAINVQQLAEAQTVKSAEFANTNQSVVGTGTLTIQLGTVDATGKTFTAGGASITIKIGDGTLTGIASAINGAKAGVTASVVQGSDGKYQLVTTGTKTGAANAFSIGGIAGLTYDPTAPASSALTLGQAAQDAHYTVNGTAETSPSNQGAPVAPGVVATLAALGPATVSAPYGQQQAAAAANKLVTSFNSLLSSMAALAAPGGNLNADPSVAAKLAQAMSTVAGETLVRGKGLADIGITAGPGGALAIDPTKLQSAYAADPTGSSAVIVRAATSLHQALAGLEGPNGAIGKETRALVSVMSQGSSLLSYLLPGSSASSSSSMLSALGTASSASSRETLADYLSAASRTSNSDPLLAALNTKP
jgi:flagellar hook-associated protein 2